MIREYEAMRREEDWITDSTKEKAIHELKKFASARGCPQMRRNICRDIALRRRKAKAIWLMRWPSKSGASEKKRQAGSAH